MTTVHTERRVLELLRHRYKSKGFTLVENPPPADLPGFMQGYRPDAVALSKERSIAIEILARRDKTTETRLSGLRDRFVGQAGWELHIVYGDELESEKIAAPTREQVRAQIEEAQNLLEQAHPRAALLLAWAAIEAAARARGPELRAVGPWQALELLEHLGYLSFEEAQGLRKLLPLRNRIAHGDAETPVTSIEVEPVLRAARTALEAA